METIVDEMKQKVLDYFKNELKLGEKAVEMMLIKVSKYDDIYESFLVWLEERVFDNIETPCICEYNPKKLSEKFSHLQGIGIFNLMVDLRDNQDITIEKIKQGLKRK